MILQDVPLLLALALLPLAWTAPERPSAPPPLKMTDRCVTKIDRVVRFVAASVARDKRLELVGGFGHGSGLLQDPSIRALFDEFLRVHSN